MKQYDPIAIEEKWLRSWEENQLFQGTAGKSFAEKFYALFAFAYPSGSGLHVGHVESKTALDIMVRYLRMTGKDVFFPVGWDAFGLPAENYAIKTGIHPAQTTKDAIMTFRRQIKRVGISYDWETELATCHPGYYKWTQWIFVQLFKAGLAYRDKGWVNWCPSCKTVLANEQVVNGECERCGSKVVQKELEQWKFKITHYQDELLSGLDQVDWPKATKEQQINWIGKSEGVQVTWSIVGSQKTLQTFTTRLDTVFGVTFVVISPEKFKEHGLLELVGDDQRQTVLNYLDQSFHKTEEQRRIGEKDKSGVNTHIKLTHPLTKEEIPLWIADYVLAGYGTGVVQGVPAHDERDYAFAKKFDIAMIDVIKGTKEKYPEGTLFTEYGTLINSKEYSGMTSKEAITKLLTDHPQVFETKTTYKLRDWLISRQRYWGAPIPMTFCQSCGWQAVPEQQLPVLLPELSDFTPTDDGRSPLEKADPSWLYTKCPSCGGKAKREVDTMDTFVDSSWYFLRYTSRNDEQHVFDVTQTNKLLPVDMYLIGPEHIVLHLLYARFFTKFLRDQGYLSFGEPFMKMRHQGMILGPDGKKMSKSKGNVINPDDVIEKFGADTLRVYEMFMGPLEGDKAWDMTSVAGVYRFLSRIYTLFQKNLAIAPTDSEENLKRKLHKTIKKLTSDIPDLKFNTSIAMCMELTNVWSDAVTAGKGLDRDDLAIVAQLMAPFAPYLAEELWTLVEKEGSVHLSTWPSYNSEYVVENTVEYAVQVNGKVKAKCSIARTHTKEEITELVLDTPEVKALKAEASIKNIIVVPNRLVNIVV